MVASRSGLPPIEILFFSLLALIAVSASDSFGDTLSVRAHSRKAGAVLSARCLSESEFGRLCLQINRDVRSVNLLVAGVSFQNLGMKVSNQNRNSAYVL